SGHDVVIALTHLRMSDDVKVLIASGEDGPDIIFGGHEHNRQCTAVGNRLVVKADADARSAAVAKISLNLNGKVKTTFRYVPLDAEIGKDAAMLAELENIGAEFDVDFCQKSLMPEGCLDVELGKTNVVLEGEELKIRKHETNLGNFIADQALGAYPNAQIAFLNSGAMRLNQDIAAGAVLRERHLREIFQYPGALYEIEITGETLRKVVDHAVEDWPGNGWWLQISGFRYSHYPDVPGEKARNLQILEGGFYRDVKRDEKIRAVTNGYMLAYPRKSDQDGYEMLNANQIIRPIPGKAPTMVEQTRQAIALTTEGIAPALQGRIRCEGKSCLDVGESSCSQFETLELSFN
ncbi:MAG: 2',3'-cyclic-nucleotide 2'-phosphodiesterase (5'-nucleotidase family), partial [Candidatus Azotimanducaceae bacterium]